MSGDPRVSPGLRMCQIRRGPFLGKESLSPKHLNSGGGSSDCAFFVGKRVPFRGLGPRGRLDVAS